MECFSEFQDVHLATGGFYLIFLIFKLTAYLLLKHFILLDFLLPLCIYTLYYQ